MTVPTEYGGGGLGVTEATIVFVPDADRVGAEGDGFRAILAGLNAERVISANAAIGIGRAALRRTTDYANQRVVFAGRSVRARGSPSRSRKPCFGLTPPKPSDRRRPG